MKTQIESTTRIVGSQEKFDQKDQMHTQAAIGGLGEKVQERWTRESIDPFRRIFFPENRAMNVPMRSWYKVADGPLNPNKIAVSDPQHMSDIIKGALTRSEYLVLLCSPAARASVYVGL